MLIVQWVDTCVNFIEPCARGTKNDGGWLRLDDCALGSGGGGRGEGMGRRSRGGGEGGNTELPQGVGGGQG